tara:strand:- start:891 stop:1706 length:816 start_codon:yes stop_codon:yes gene_type:complete
MKDNSNIRIDSFYSLDVVEKPKKHIEKLAFKRTQHSSEKVDYQSEATFASPSRWIVMERNLLQGIEFLKEQDKQLKLVGMLLDNLRKALTAFHEHKNDDAFNLHSQIFSCRVIDISRARYGGVPLFGNEIEVPLKFHVYESGERKVHEITRGNLSGPALRAIAYGGRTVPPSHRLLLDATKEILELRSLNSRQSAKLQHSYSRVLDKLKSLEKRRISLLGKPCVFRFSETKNKQRSSIENGHHGKVPVTKRLVDFFITSPIHRFTMLSQRK